ncbi:predicted protein [Verticillium alfalfae VaMs.102]|uniref:Predicted protein n=1 Tax=Verticillium alfalfae (strain VaMs.102 / ATCC MYA-4576 / FGSC 10136) TaxID=526221 RepID=C9SIS8_VERA1|nr:predicted protein [Verticillium alfalfae VaMs.102]EEY18851.1 predicted protein [Verticillium alfalfae VaMs.102]
MAGFLNKLKSAGTGTTSPAGKDAAAKKKEALEPPPEITPLEKMLQNAGPLRDDGTDRFFGLENDAFRQNVVNYPPYSPSETPNGDGTRPKVQVSIRAADEKETERRRVLDVGEDDGDLARGRGDLGLESLERRVEHVAGPGLLAAARQALQVFGHAGRVQRHALARGADSRRSIRLLRSRSFCDAPHEVAALGPDDIDDEARRHVLPELARREEDDVVRLADRHVADVGGGLHRGHEADVAEGARDLEQVVELAVARHPAARLPDALAFRRLGGVVLARQDLVRPVGLDEHGLRVADVGDEQFGALQGGGGEPQDGRRKKRRRTTRTRGASPGGILSRANRGSKSMTKKSFSFLNKDRSDTGENGANGDGSSSPAESKLKDRFSFNLGRRKSSNLLS